eukprot:scaffold27385_cov47-Attheya_sp.AAC.4
MNCSAIVNEFECSSSVIVLFRVYCQPQKCNGVKKWNRDKWGDNGRGERPTLLPVTAIHSQSDCSICFSRVPLYRLYCTVPEYSTL